MILRHSKNPSTLMIRLGAAFLALANTTLWFVRRTPAASRDWTDAAMGAAFGVAIGFLLLGVYFKNRKRA